MSLFALVALCLAPGAARGAGDGPVMAVKRVVEQRYRDDGLAVFVPDRLELIARSSPSGPWGFCFAGFETSWRRPIDLEVTGSGGYATQDVFSIAAISIDYGKTGGGWSERSLFGLGLLQNTRPAHPPSWGAGGGGRVVIRQNLVNAGPAPQRLTIDIPKFAPKDWDGRVWIGLMMHNVGTNKSLKARIVNAQPPAGALGPERDEKALWALVHEHERQFLEHALADLSKHPPAEESPETRVPEAMKPYAGAIARTTPAALRRGEIERTLQALKENHPSTAQAMMTLISAVLEGDPGSARAHAAAVDALRTLYDQWQKSGSFGWEIHCIVRAASNLEKVTLTDATTGRVIGTTGDPIRISAARREHEGFQVVLTPLAGAPEKVSLAAGDLKRDDGATIAASSITINPVGYVRIFEGSGGEQLRPDPLLIGHIPALKPGENQPVWVSVRVPDDAGAGVYRGDVTIATPGADKLSIPVELTVRSFEIPKQISLRSSFWMFRDQLNRFYHLNEINLDDYLKWIDFALEHRLNPIDVYEGQCGQLLPIINTTGDDPKQRLAGPVNSNPDFTNWDRYIDRMLTGGANTIPLGTSHHFGAFFADAEHPVASPGQIQRVEQAIRILRKHYEARGIFDKHYLQLRDETSAPESLNVYREVHKDLPQVKLLLTAPSGDARPLLQIPCPLTPGFDAGWRDDVHKAGGEYWWYVCVQPSDRRFANFFLDQSAVHHRALFWQTWSHDVDGLLYWGMNFWSWYDYQWPAGSKGPTMRVPPKGSHNFCPLPEAPGDGFSMYPGPTPDRPLSSVRLEVMRDGEEDYEYLVLLDRLIAKASGDAARADAVKQAKAVRAAAGKMVESLTDFEQAPSAYLEMRDKIAIAIEALMAP